MILLSWIFLGTIIVQWKSDIDSPSMKLTCTQTVTLLPSWPNHLWKRDFIWLIHFKKLVGKVILKCQIAHWEIVIPVSIFYKQWCSMFRNNLYFQPRWKGRKVSEVMWPHKSTFPSWKLKYWRISIVLGSVWSLGCASGNDYTLLELKLFIN